MAVGPRGREVPSSLRNGPARDGSVAGGVGRNPVGGRSRGTLGPRHRARRLRERYEGETRSVSVSRARGGDGRWRPWIRLPTGKAGGGVWVGSLRTSGGRAGEGRGSSWSDGARKTTRRATVSDRGTRAPGSERGPQGRPHRVPRPSVAPFPSTTRRERSPRPSPLGTRPRSDRRSSANEVGERHPNGPGSR